MLPGGRGPRRVAPVRSAGRSTVHRACSHAHTRQESAHSGTRLRHCRSRVFAPARTLPRPSVAVRWLAVVRRGDAPPLAAAAMVGTTGVFQHAEQPLAVMAVDTDAAA